MLSSATTFACFNAFLLITVLDISHDTKGVLSAALMSSAVSVGVLVGSVIASLVVQRVPGGIVVVAFYLLMAVGSLGAAFASQTVVRMAFLFASLLVFPAGNAVVGGFQTLLINKENLGKVAAGMGVIGMAVGPVVSALAGLGSERLGYTAISFILTASIAVLALPALTLKGLITLPGPDQWQQHIKRCGLTTF